MSADLTRLVSHSGYNAFKNNAQYKGTLNISGTTSPGINTRTFNIDLFKAPDLLDIIFNGPADTMGNDPRPADGWFKQGAVYIPTNNVAFGSPSKWIITTQMTTSTTVTVTATYLWTGTPGETLTATDFYYKIVDYSVF